MSENERLDDQAGLMWAMAILGLVAVVVIIAAKVF